MADLRRRMAEQRVQIQRRIDRGRDRASTSASAFSAALLSARSIADQTVSHRAQLNGLKVQLRKHETDLAQALTGKQARSHSLTSRVFQSHPNKQKSKYKLIDESISNTTATNERLRSLVMEQRQRRDECTKIISNQLQAIESPEADSAAQGEKNLDEAIMWYDKFLGFQVVGGEGVKFVFNKIDVQSPDKEYLFCIKLAKKNTAVILQCVPFVDGSKELVRDLNCDNDLFKFVRIMRERFQAATITGVLPASSFCPVASSITSSSLSSLSLDSRSENTANQTQSHILSGTKNQEIKKGLPNRSAISPGTVLSSKRHSLRILVRTPLKSSDGYGVTNSMLGLQAAGCILDKQREVHLEVEDFPFFHRDLAFSPPKANSNGLRGSVQQNKPSLYRQASNMNLTNCVFCKLFCLFWHLSPKLHCIS
ncbi:hypothetical protein EJB05_32206 [Eragrostis curvula]|uniref:Kinetochore protein SPC25 n=1 Tax=Eragrostis curvula TaxID=38414 RepID=A0A5J9UGD9_9POAL|nr:hypothetical protein EJB05_32206 [Eragrostis curvula]